MANTLCDDSKWKTFESCHSFFNSSAGTSWTFFFIEYLKIHCVLKNKRKKVIFVIVFFLSINGCKLFVTMLGQFHYLSAQSLVIDCSYCFVCNMRGSIWGDESLSSCVGLSKGGGRSYVCYCARIGRALSQCMCALYGGEGDLSLSLKTHSSLCTPIRVRMYTAS